MFKQQPKCSAEEGKVSVIFGTRHLQVFLISLSLMTGSMVNLSLFLAIIAMTDPRAENLSFKYHNWTPRETSLILSAYMLGYATFQVPNGYLAKVWSARKLFSIGLLLSGLVNLSLPFLAEYGGWAGLSGGRIVIGVCQSCFSSCTHTLLSKWAPPGERTRLCAWATTGHVQGAIVAMLLSGLIAASAIGWPGIFFIFGSTGVFCSLLLFFYLSDSPSSHKTICPKEKAFISKSFQQIQNHTKFNKVNPPWKKILTSVPVWALIATETGSLWGASTINMEMPNYLKSIYNYDIAKNGLVSTIPYMAFWLLSLAFSCVSDYALRKNISVSRIRRTSNTVGMWGSALALVILCQIRPNRRAWAVLLLVLAVGLKAGTTTGAIVNQIDLSPNFAGTISSISTSIGTFISIFAPMICGIIVQDQKNVEQWHCIFYITALLYFVTNLAFLKFGRGKIQSWNDPDQKKSISIIYEP